MNRKTIHGIDPYAPGGIEALLAHHRATFGDAVMQDGGTPPAGGETPPAEPPATPPATPPAPPAPPATPPAAPPTPPAPPAAPKTFDEDYVKTLREEAASHRVRATQAEKATEAAVAEATRPLQVQLAVTLAAITAGANAADLLDSSKFSAAIKDIDPTDSAAVSAAITSFVTENPRFKAVQAAGASGGDFTGGTGEHRKAPTTLEDAVAQKMAR